MNIGNIDSFNNRDLVIFLQKVGQHEAAKVVKKHMMNGKTLLSLRSQNTTVNVTDVEKNQLWRCLNLIQFRQLNPLHVAHLSPKCPSDDSNLQSKQDKSFASQSHVHKQITPRTNKYTEDENGYIQVEKPDNIPLQEKDKHEYFKFINGGSKSLVINKSSTTSSGYIRPISQIYIQRHEQIAVNRVEKHAHQDEINESEEHFYDCVLQPSNIVINSVEDSGKINEKSFVLCDFLLSIFCFSCSISCKRK